MKPFRTNKKDRETFARVLGHRLYECTDFKCGTDADIRDYEDNKIIGCEKGQWYFMHNGFQRTVARLHELGLKVGLYHGECDIWNPNIIGEGHADGIGKSPNTGEALFRAVVAMGEAQNER